MCHLKQLHFIIPTPWVVSYFQKPLHQKVVHTFSQRERNPIQLININMVVKFWASALFEWPVLSIPLWSHSKNIFRQAEGIEFPILIEMMLRVGGRELLFPEGALEPEMSGTVFIYFRKEDTVIREQTVIPIILHWLEPWVSCSFRYCWESPVSLGQLHYEEMLVEDSKDESLIMSKE